MRLVITIYLIIISHLFVKANDSIDIEVKYSQNIVANIDTVKFVNDTAWVAESPKVSYIIYADNTSNSNIIGEYFFPIIMLLLGVGIDRFIVWSSEKKRVKKYGKRWIAELRGILEPIKKQQASLSFFIAEYCEKPEQVDMPSIAVFNAANGATFNSLGKEDLYEYLENRKGIHCDVIYQKICSIIFSLELTHKQFIEQLNEFRNSLSNLIELYNKHIQQYRTFLLDLVSHSGKGGMKTEDADELVSIYNEVFKDEGHHCNVFKSIDEFINPSLKILKKYKTNDITIQMIHDLSSCYDCVVAMKNEKVYIKENFKQAYRIYEFTAKETSNVLKLFENKK